MTHQYQDRRGRREGYMSGVFDWLPSTDRLMSQARRRPEAFLVIAAGLALLLRGERRRVEVYRSAAYPRGNPSSRAGGVVSETYRSRMERADEDAMAGWASSASEGGREAMERARDIARDAGERMTHYASDVAQQISETTSEYASSAARWAEGTSDELSRRSSHLAQQARSLPGELDDAVRDHPVVLAALGVAVGAAIGASLPATSIENRTMGDVARQAGGRFTEAAEEALDEAKRQAERRGLSTEGMKGMARDVAGAFTSAATGSSEQGRSESRAENMAPSSSGQTASGSGSGFAQPAPLSTSSAGAGASGQRRNPTEPNKV
jgi:ElaB/YqjD/DUF883 family membrane-anchored ribosome-binding protein